MMFKGVTYWHFMALLSIIVPFLPANYQMLQHDSYVILTTIFLTKILK